MSGKKEGSAGSGSKKALSEAAEIVVIGIDDGHIDLVIDVKRTSLAGSELELLDMRDYLVELSLTGKVTVLVRTGSGDVKLTAANAPTVPITPLVRE